MAMANARGVLLAFGLAAAAAARAQAPGADALPAGVQKIAPERLAHYWLLVPESAQANAPNSGAGLNTPTCVAVSYVIEKNGTTSHVKLERVIPPGPLGKVATNVVKGMRFAPARDNVGKDPVVTYVVMPFNAPGAESTAAADRAERKRVIEPCNLADSAAPAK
ncbi:MAG TPA: hypothetical protein VN720_04775 [Rudaea sp.]|nr:hypothetical protein [Rudaea sp.]